jgi:hypothetical protein
MQPGSLLVSISSVGPEDYARVVEVWEASVRATHHFDQALGFYLRLGFEVVGRSELDSNGKPYPLLHMRLARADEIG